MALDECQSHLFIVRRKTINQELIDDPVLGDRVRKRQRYLCQQAHRLVSGQDHLLEPMGIREVHARFSRDVLTDRDPAGKEFQPFRSGDDVGVDVVDLEVEVIEAVASYFFHKCGGSFNHRSTDFSGH